MSLSAQKCQECDIALSPELMTVINATDLKTRQEVAIAYLSRVSKSEWDNVSESETGLGISAIIEAIPVQGSFNNSNSEESYSNLVDDLKSYAYQRGYSLDWNKTFVRIANRDLTSAWLRCKEKCFNRDGTSLIKSKVKLRSENNSKDNVFTLHLNLQPQYGITKDEVIRVKLINCKSLEGDLLEKGMTITQTDKERLFLFSIDDIKKPVTIVVDFNRGGTQNLVLYPLENDLPKKKDVCSPTYDHDFIKFSSKMTLKSYFETYVGAENLMTRPFYCLNKQKYGSQVYYFLFTAGWGRTNGNLMGFWISEHHFRKYFCFIEKTFRACPENPGTVSFRINDPGNFNPGAPSNIRIGWMKEYGRFTVYRESLTHLEVYSTNSLPSGVSKSKCK